MSEEFKILNLRLPSTLFKKIKDLGIKNNVSPTDFFRIAIGLALIQFDDENIKQGNSLALVNSKGIIIRKIKSDITEKTNLPDTEEDIYIN